MRISHAQLRATQGGSRGIHDVILWRVLVGKSHAGNVFGGRKGKRKPKASAEQEEKKVRNEQKPGRGGGRGGGGVEGRERMYALLLSSILPKIPPPTYHLHTSRTFKTKHAPGLEALPALHHFK